MLIYLRGKGRFLLLGALAALTVLYLMSTPSRPSFAYRPGRSARDSRSEMARLEKYMNEGEPLTPTTLTWSSFNWSAVLLANPPTPEEAATRLPRTPGRLPTVQHRFPAEGPAEANKRETRRQEVKKAFQKTWQSYRRLAWGKDALQPLSGTGRDQFAGWAATLVDALDTLWIMGLREEFDEAVAYAAGIDFGECATSSSGARVNVFETNIRYLGGLLAAYDLSGREVLLQKATELGDLLYAAFDTPNRMPVDSLDFDAAKASRGLVVEGGVVSAAPGTLSLEMAHLSQVTGDDKYYAAVQGVMRLFERGQNRTRIPGVWPTYVSMSAQDVTSGTQFTLGGNADSLYEYLPKMHALLGGAEPMYEEMSANFLRAADDHFFFRPMLPRGDDILISGMVNVPPTYTSTDFDAPPPPPPQPTLDPESEHLTCFIGGTVALGGKLLGLADHVETGARLAKGCAYVYRSFPTGIGPERWNMVPCDPPRTPDAGLSKEPHCAWNESRWDEEKAKQWRYEEHLPKGFTTAKDPRYLLRPEAIESLFVLYRITGEIWYQDAAWDMFNSVVRGTETEFANAAVLDVTKDVGGGDLPKEDYMESFWLAETLKYFYLIFSSPDLINLDHFVLNTEAHPFRRPT